MFDFDNLVMKSADELGATATSAPAGSPAAATAVEVIGGVACPIDPMERLQCESCQ